MKRFLSVLLAFALILACAPKVPIGANAATIYSGTCGDNLTWDLDHNYTLTISGIGKMDDYRFTYSDDTNRAPWYYYGIENVIIEDGVTSIGNDAFTGCSSLTSVVIPDSVTSIGSTAFSGCSSLESVVIGDSVTSIGSSAFYGCSRLTSVEIGDSVASIGYDAFFECYNLIEFRVDGDNAYYSNDAYGVLFNKDKTRLIQCPTGFVGSYTIPDSVTNISDSAFIWCYGLDNVVIPDSVTDMGDYTFEQSGLESIIIGKGITRIGSGSFYLCTYLDNVIIGSNVTIIGVNAFTACWDLTSIAIPDSVTTIEDRAFEQCYYLEDVYFAGSQAQWWSISIGSDNYDLTDAMIHYNHVHDYTLFPPVEVAATCTQEGGTQYTCVYGDTYLENVTPALGHNYSGEKIEVQPTCTERGYTGTKCIRCNDVKISKYTDALGHSCPNAETIKEPTCTETGTAIGQCVRCNEMITSTVASLRHKMVAVPAVDATCTTDGTTVGTKCERCGLVGIAQTTVPATGHNIVNGTCTGCGLGRLVAHKQGDAETYYNTLEEALAVTGGTIQLLADVTADVVSINPGVVLDLNGYTLTASSVEGKVMDSDDGKGLVKVGVKNAVLSSNEDQLILWDNATENPGYRVFNYTFTNMGMDAHKDDATESAKRGTTLKSFWSDLVFTNPYAYTLVASSYSTLSVGFEVSWTPEGGAATSKTFTFGTSVVADWGAAEESNAGDKNYCFYIGLTGFDDLLTDGTVEVKPVVKTAFNTDEAESTQIKYDYVKKDPAGLVYEYGFGTLKNAGIG